MLNPNDDALLNDLLDERLTPAEEAAVSARLEREPALREAWDELVRAREFFREVPDPVPPADFVARVRARLTTDDVSADGAAGGSAADGSAEEVSHLSVAAARAATEAGSPGASNVPVAWRRLMTVAYAAAAALVLGIGVFALKDRERAGDGGSQATESSETARADARDRESRVGRVGDAARAERGLEADDAKALADAAWDAGNRVPPPAGGSAPAESSLAAKRPESFPDATGATAQGGETGAARDAKPSGFSGPGGVVPPGLRQPSDPPPAPASPEKPQPADLLRTKEDAPAADAYGDVLVLEAASLEAGVRLLESVLAGPGAAPAGSGGSGGGVRLQGATTVALRRLDRRRDAALLAALAPASTGGTSGPAAAGPPPPAAAPAPAAPPPPAAPPSGPPTTPAPLLEAGPTPAPKATKAPAGNPSVLGVETRSLGPDEISRLEALLGPAPGAADARGKRKGASKTDGESSDKDAAVPLRQVRVVIVLPATGR